MNSHLSYQLAQHHIADLQRTAERPRRADRPSDGPTKPRILRRIVLVRVGGRHLRTRTAATE